MKFAHLADTHLGYRQFGLIEREEDFYEVFENIITRIIEEKVDFVIHSGDLFETAKPSPKSILIFQKALFKLKGAGIPMYVIAGNHDTVFSEGSIPPQVIFKKLGLKVISPINTHYIHDDVFIGGLPFYPKTRIKDFKNRLEIIANKAKDYEKSILVLHQGIDMFLPFQYELEIGEIPQNFNYYALGHIHNYIEHIMGKGCLVYPGSTEIWKVNELKDSSKNGKGFVIVDFDDDKPVVNRITIKSPRKFLHYNCDLSDLEEFVFNIKDEIYILDKKPILTLDINNVDGESSEIHDFIYNQLDDLCLTLRLTFNNSDDTNAINVLNNEGSLAIKELIIKNLESYNNDKINDLACELYDYLSKNKQDEAENIINAFYELNYLKKNSKEEEDF